MPKSWHVQMDSASDNKCKYVFAYFTHYVACGGATDIEINFLMVGHTHEDIDGTSLFASDARVQLDVRAVVKLTLFDRSMHVCMCGNMPISDVLSYLGEAEGIPWVASRYL